MFPDTLEKLEVLHPGPELVNWIQRLGLCKDNALPKLREIYIYARPECGDSIEEFGPNSELQTAINIVEDARDICILYFSTDLEVRLERSEERITAGTESPNPIEDNVEIEEKSSVVSGRTDWILPIRKRKRIHSEPELEQTKRLSVSPESHGMLELTPPPASQAHTPAAKTIVASRSLGSLAALHNDESLADLNKTLSRLSFAPPLNNTGKSIPKTRTNSISQATAISPVDDSQNRMSPVAEASKGQGSSSHDADTSKPPRSMDCAIHAEETSHPTDKELSSRGRTSSSIESFVTLGIVTLLGIALYWFVVLPLQVESARVAGVRVRVKL
ncbi:hypothetical protein K491DRAFT_697874 [Lophiostoma macrostomum CBS 122681]|uniref:Uncharacterized protein n=1 Tax=Lophiostoma macrostomum CBS 122681 TaxID=1314788 RepID=A0A6A6SU53_9PLEO|nr:hypothetical protein K491DRAFT_697874 [Lophiostoma macrostomum CBS 122681]